MRILSRLRFTAPEARFHGARRERVNAGRAWMASLLWTVRASHFRSVPAKARQSVQFPRLWMPVDKWITCGLFLALEKRVEDEAGQHGSASDKSCKVRARVRPGCQRRAGLVGVIDPSARDDLEDARPNRSRSLRTFSSVVENSAGPDRPPVPWESRGSSTRRVLPQFTMLIPASSAAGMRGLLVRLAEVRRHLDDEGLPGRLSHRPEEPLDLGRSRRPLVDELACSATRC